MPSLTSYPRRTRAASPFGVGLYRNRVGCFYCIAVAVVYSITLQGIAGNGSGCWLVLLLVLIGLGIDRGGECVM